MSEPETRAEKRSFSPLRLTLMVVSVITISLVVYSSFLNAELKRTRDSQLEAVASVLELISPASATLSDRFGDADKNMVADRPANSDDIEPKLIRFSYLAGSDIEVPKKSWESLASEVAEKTGIEVEVVEYATIEEQFNAFDMGELHITAFNTGSVTRAVNDHGFVPVAALGDSSGTSGYTSKIIVSPSCDAKKPSEIASLMFTSPTSNSGFRFPLLVLAKDFDLYPDRDYVYRFSQSHELSIKAVVADEVEAAAVASDVLDLVVEKQALAPDAFRIIYESSQFPTACFGHPHNLQETLANQITESLQGFSFKGKELESTFAASGFVGLTPIDFKEDFSEVRLIESIIEGALDLDRLSRDDGQP